MSNGSLAVYAGGTVTLTGSSDQISAGQGNATVGIIGNSDTITGGSGNVVTFTGTSDAAILSNGTIGVTAGSNVAVTGNSDQISAGQGNATVAVNGSSDSFQGGSGTGDSVSVNGQSDTIVMSGGSLNVGVGSSAALIGGNDTYTLSGLTSIIALIGVSDVYVGNAGVTFVYGRSHNATFAFQSQGASDNSGSGSQINPPTPLIANVSFNQPFSGAYGTGYPPEAFLQNATPSEYQKYVADQKAALDAQIASTAAAAAANAQYAQDLNSEADGFSIASAAQAMTGNEPEPLLLWRLASDCAL